MSGNLSLQLGFQSAATGAYSELIELCGSTTDAPYLVQWDGLDYPPPPLKSIFAGAPLRDGAELAAESYDNRVLTIPLDVNGGSSVELESNWAALNRWLGRVSAYALDSLSRRVDDVPVVRLRLASGGIFLLYPLSGMLAPPSSSSSSSLAQTLAGGLQPYDLLSDSDGNQHVIGATLTLTCRPFAYGQPVSYAATGTLANGSAVLDLPAIPGDAAALVRVIAGDQSSSGAVNRLRLSLVSQSDYPVGAALSAVSWSYPFANPAATPAGVGTWASAADTDTIAGTHIRFTPAATSFDFSAIARVLYNTAPSVNSGLYLPLARVRDNAALVTPVISTASPIAGGSLTQGVSYSYAVTALNGSGETAGSNLATVYLASGKQFNANSVSLTWEAINGATSYRLYRSTNGGSTWAGYFTTTNTAYIDTGASPTAGSPPTTSTATASGSLTELALYAGFYGDAADNLQFAGTGYTVVGGGSYELVAFEPVQLPPGRLPAGYGNPGWQAQLYARRATTLTGTLDLDSLLLFPLAASMTSVTPAYAELVYSSLANAVKGDWVAEQDINELVSGVLADSGGNALSGLAGGGSLRARPGNARLWATAHMGGDVHSVVNTSLTLAARVIPRWLNLPG